MALKLQTIICSTRPGRIGPYVAKWFHAYATQNSSFETRLVDLAEFNLPVFDEPHHPRTRKYLNNHTQMWSARVADADAYVFVTPEYDYFPPSSLVNALQYLSAEWAYKVAGFVSYGGISGGLRAVQTARQILGALRLVSIPECVPVPMVAQFIDENRKFTPNEPMIAGSKLMLDELERWAAALKTMR
jgi:NAD(P)H-dependent FMN reductase